MNRRLLVVFLCALFAAGTATAQQSGSIQGSVKDEQGGVLPGANVTLSGPASRTAVSGSTGAFRFDNLPAGAYKLTVHMLGFKDQEQTANVTEGAAAEVSFSLALGALRGEEITVTADKGKAQLVVDAPATVSVITSDTLEASPAQNYGDLLRTVPGVNVIQLSNRDINLTTRQATSTLSNSQLALLDGRSIYLDFFGLILWDLVPANMSEIKQIEVVRGPASAVWGANALTGVVNIITKTPREAPGGSVTLGAGLIERKCDNCSRNDTGGSFGGAFTYAAAPNDKWSWKISGGYFHSSPYSRPTGRIPLIPDPRIPNAVCDTATGRGDCVGGILYPADSSQGQFGTVFENASTSQPKVDLRVDQELGGGRITYQGGYAGTTGIVHTGLGPFQLQSGSYLGYARVGYAKNAFKVSGFVNFLDAKAPNLLAFDPLTQKPLQLNFTTQTYDFEVGNSNVFGSNHILTYGGNARRNNFDITLAKTAQDRNEYGAYAQYEYFSDHFRVSVGGRVDKFGNLDKAFFSPRVSLILKPSKPHSLRLSFNRAFRSPSAINNYLDLAIVEPVDLRGLGPLLPPPLQPAVATPFPLVVYGVGSELPINGQAQKRLKPESLNAYEIGYTGTFEGKTTVSAAFYINDQNENLNFAVLPPSLDPYTAQNPPPGWVARGLPPSLLTILAHLPAQLGGPIYLPRTAFTYLNLGPLRNQGFELGVDHAFNREWSFYANYSYQKKPQVRKAASDQIQYPTDELALPPTNRVNGGVNWNTARFVGSASINYSDGAFWSDVLTDPYFGFTDKYTLANATFGVKWADGKVTTSIKGINLFNQDVQQHIFGDILKRSLSLELRWAF